MQIETAVLSDSGHSAAGPTALFDQSKARMRSPISPPPFRKLKSPDCGAVFSRAGLGTRFFAVGLADIPGPKIGGFKFLRTGNAIIATKRHKKHKNSFVLLWLDVIMGCDFFG